MAIREKGFLYETHMHTSEGSACGACPGAEMARAYAEAGYAGIIITDHFFYGNTAVDRSLPWKEWVEQYCLGYENAKEEGEKLGLQVFFGWESCYSGTEFLIYGLDKDWLLRHPEIRDATVEEQQRLVHADGGIVVQAHPYREASYISEIRLFPQYIDGVEGINASHSSLVKKVRHPEYNDRAIAYAKKYDLPLTAGSDQHSTEMLWGGMLFPRRLRDIHDFAQAVLSREALRLLDGTEA
ncbi:MAG: PHP domain-containing protein [Roseburia sp.]|nr:PHP domain-containing protein [Roseburia sp.]MCM1099558.1 PHP domain-containing protein [Ruminococcus flavefaciens]